MPTLNWIGKQAVVTHHKEVPYRLLEPVSELSCGGANSGNLWAARSGGRCRFAWIENRNWAALCAAVQ